MAQAGPRRKALPGAAALPRDAEGGMFDAWLAARVFSQDQDRSMRLTDILRADCVTVALQASDRQQAIAELVDLLAARIGLVDADTLKTAVWEREKTRTTGIGHGIAIPHGKAPSVKQLHMVMAKPVKPIDFAAIDGKPVDLIFLITSPMDQTGPHIQALASITKMLVDTGFRSRLKQATSAEALYQLIAERDAQSVA
jgi:fructose-specific phosphotransferase system IIA component